MVSIKTHGEDKTVKIAKISSRGGRAFNQDYADYAVAGQYVCIAVGDGLGAYSGSEVASETAVRAALNWFRKAVKKDDDLFTGAAMNKLFKCAHASVHKVKGGAPELRGSCTTLSVVIADDEKLIAAHEGDTRIYFFNDNSIEFYSKDHSLARLAADKGEIAYADIRTHRDQNKLLRVVGADYFTQPDYKIRRNHGPNDSVLICTDGFWEFVYEYDMEDALKTTGSATEALKDLENRLNLRVTEGNDNYTAMLLRFSGNTIGAHGDSGYDGNEDFYTEPDDDGTTGAIAPEGSSYQDK